jgi:hypothetical protein
MALGVRDLDRPLCLVDSTDRPTVANRIDIANAKQRSTGANAKDGYSREHQH